MVARWKQADGRTDHGQPGSQPRGLSQVSLSKDKRRSTAAQAQQDTPRARGRYFIVKSEIPTESAAKAKRPTPIGQREILVRVANRGQEVSE